MRPAILIHGPTASGKTALSVAVARKVGGEVVNADSMQVYGEWLEAAGNVIEDIFRRGKVPVITGGTGLYLLALTQGMSSIPPVPDDIRADVMAISRAEGAAGLRQRLEAVDPETASRFGEGDRQRLSRAYEVWLATGKSISSFQDQRMRPVLGEGEWLGLALTPPRNRLYSRIDRRFEGMLMEGAMEEARGLVAMNLDPELPAMKAHGMPWLAAFIRGEISAELAAENAKRDTRRYAKRQFTWIGRQFPFWPRIPSPELSDRMRVVFALYKELDRG